MLKSPPKPKEALKRAREERNWTQSEAASIIGCSLESVQSWERGRRNQPGPKWRARLCEVYQKSPEELELLPSLSKKTELITIQDTPAFPSAGVLGQERALDELEYFNVLNLVYDRKSLFRQIGDKKRRRMLMNVWDICIDGKLRRLLGQTPFIVLDLMEVSKALDSSGHVVVQETNQRSAHDLPSGTSIVHVYDDADGELLILGEAGSGKTVLLLELAHALLLRAEQNESSPMPVVFSLSSWKKEQTSLDEWIVAELQRTYHIPQKIGQAWVETDQLIVLLDGLDETSEESRPACVEAIQAYQEKHPLVSLVLCCRREKYDAQVTSMLFQQTVFVKPLTEEHIHLYLASSTSEYEAVKKALQEDPELQEMCTNPLMLTMVTRVYQDERNADLVLSGSIETRRRQIFDRYIQGQLTQSGMDPRYTHEQTMHWLAFLAWQMKKHNLPELYIERIQPSWVENDQQRHLYQRTVIRFIICFHCAMAGALAAWLKGGLRNGVMGSGNGILGLFGGGAGNSMLGWMAPGIGGGSLGGASLIIMLGLMIWLITVLVGSPSLPVVTPRAVWQGLVSGGRAGLLMGVAGTTLSLPLFLLRGGFSYGISYSLGVGFLMAIIMGLMRGLGTGLRYGQEEPTTGTERKGSFSDRLRDGLVWGTCGDLGFMAVEEALRVNQHSTLIYGTVMFLFFFFAYGFGGGDRLFSSLQVLRIEPTETVVWSWRHLFHDLGKNSLKSLIVALVVASTVSLVITAISSSFYRDLDYGIHYGLVFGVISGLIVSIASLLATMLKSGWSSNILPEEQHTRTNEGIARSGKNALLGACLVAPIGGITSGLACGIGFGLIGELPTWPTMAMAFAVMLSIIIFVIFLTAHGGIAYVAHYTLRFYLSRAGNMPKDYVQFLNTASRQGLVLKVEGRYIFLHRLLLEHFAGLCPSAHRSEKDLDSLDEEKQTMALPGERAKTMSNHIVSVKGNGN